MILPRPEQRRPLRLMDIIAVIWLLSLTTVLGIEHRTQARLAAQLNTRATAQQVEALHQQVAHLSQLIGEYQPPADILSLSRYEADSQAFGQRLRALEKSLDGHSAAESLQPLRARLEQLEEQLAAQRATPPIVVQHHRPAPPKPRKSKAPFQIVGLEQRAGEQFLLLLPINTPNDSLTRLQLLHPGEEEAGWRLEGIEGNTALFRHGDDTRRLPIPTEPTQ